MDNTERYIHDAYTSMAERTIRRLWILCVVVFLAFVVSNVIWICYECRYSTESTTTIDASQDGEGFNFIGGGNVSYRTESENYRN